jgi:hypothetical protein
MPPVSLMRNAPTIERPPMRRMVRRWSELAADSDLEDVQTQITKAIRAGSIRVRPWPGQPQRVRITAVEVACPTQ